MGLHEGQLGERGQLVDGGQHSEPDEAELAIHRVAERLISLTVFVDCRQEAFRKEIRFLEAKRWLASGVSFVSISFNIIRDI